MNAPKYPSTLGAWYGLSALIIAAMAANAIMPLMTLVTDPIKHDLGLSDGQIGAMRGVGTSLVSTLGSYPIAWLADRIDRRIVFALCVVIWCAGTGLAGVANSFVFMTGCAMAIAFGESVLGPVTFALIPDLFVPERRMLANSVFFVSQLLGFAVGISASGMLLGAIDAWRPSLPALISSMPTWRLSLMANALTCVVLVPLILTIPVPRRQKAAAPAKPAADAVPREELWSYIRTHARTLFPIFIGFGAIGAANFTVFGWIAVGIMRLFHVPASDVGVRLGQVFAVASVSGVVVANLAARQLSKRSADLAPVHIAEGGALIAASVSLLYLIAPSATAFYWITAVQIAAAFGGLTLSPTVSQATSPTRLRARLIALGGIFYTVFGALSPLVVGLLSDAIGKEPRALLMAMLSVALPCYVGGVLLLRLSERTLPGTLQAARTADL
jgi:MFS family permease